MRQATSYYSFLFLILLLTLMVALPFAEASSSAINQIKEVCGSNPRCAIRMAVRMGSTEGCGAMSNDNYADACKLKVEVFGSTVKAPERHSKRKVVKTSVKRNVVGAAYKRTASYEHSALKAYVLPVALLTLIGLTIVSLLYIKKRHASGRER